MMKFLCVAIVSALTINVETDIGILSGKLTPCGRNNRDSLTTKDVTISPFPVKAGNNATISVSGTLSKEIVVGSTLRVTGRVAGFQVFRTDLDLCAEAAKQGKLCPIAIGDQDLLFSQQVAGDTPAATINLEIRGTNADNTPITCLRGPMRIIK
jgi:hypothetical protein